MLDGPRYGAYNSGMAAIPLEPIAFVRGGRSEGQDDNWADERCVIELVDGFSADSLVGLDAFSHLELIFHFHWADDSKIERGARHPRGNLNWPRVGIFAQRAKDRPNHLGVSVARIVGCSGKTIEVAGLDAIDGTPMLDLKPVMAEFLPQGEIRQPAWSHELMANYWRTAQPQPQESPMAGFAITSKADADAAEAQMADLFGPGHIAQTLQMAIQHCWMALPKDRRTAAELESEMRRIFERTLANFREDMEHFKRA